MQFAEAAQKSRIKFFLKKWTKWTTQENIRTMIIWFTKHLRQHKMYLKTFIFKINKCATSNGFNTTIGSQDR